MVDSKCKICRRLGMKLFLKGERCLSQKCAMVKRAYPPGPKRKRRLGPPSEYGKELREKQRLKKWYNLSERRFQNYVRGVLEKRHKVEDATTLLMRVLESRFDNVIFRLGFAVSRSQARKLISHGHFLVNDRPVNIPSYLLKQNDKISLRPASRAKGVFKNLGNSLKKHTPPQWLQLDIEKLEGKVVGKPGPEEAAPPADISVIFEYYSR